MLIVIYVFRLLIMTAEISSIGEQREQSRNKVHVVGKITARERISGSVHQMLKVTNLKARLSWLLL